MLRSGSATSAPTPPNKSAGSVRLANRTKAAARSLHRRIFGDVLFIHTPKCAGNYIRESWAFRDRDDVRDIVHGTIRNVDVSPRTRVVGLLREPADWYASYYFFRKNNVSKRPPARDNFPPTHPISLYSRNGAASLNEMIANMRAPDFFARHALENETACIYARDWPDVFAFMHRTGSGFWTWTIMHHFCDSPTVALRTRDDVTQALHAVANRVRFIRQESIEADARNLLGRRRRDVGVLNASPRPDRLALMPVAIAMIDQMDGEAAAILGGYDVLTGNRDNGS